MSICGIVQTVHHHEDGSGKLQLRPAKDDRPIGQQYLYYDRAPPDIALLAGQRIWVGDLTILYVRTSIAERKGVGKILFSVDSIGKVIAREDARKERGNE